MHPRTGCGVFQTERPDSPGLIRGSADDHRIPQSDLLHTHDALLRCPRDGELLRRG